MFPNNWYGDYEYENERRNDERRAAAEDHRIRELLGNHKPRLSSPVVAFGVVAAIIVLFWLF
jgi:hypothetical protein